MFEKIIAFFMSIITFFTGLFGFDWAFNKVQSYTDLAYGEASRQKMDLYLPFEHDEEVGLILYIHGGAWIQGDKSSYSSTAKNTAKKYGYATASINYRYISETVNMFDLLDDIESALKTIKETASTNGIKIEKVLLTGYSAGAHLSLLYGYSRVDTAPIKPVAIISLSGPTDFTDSAYYENNDLGSETVIPELFSFACGKDFTNETIDTVITELLAISPISYITESTVPTIICHGDKDNIAPYSNAVTLDQKLTEKGVKHEFITYNNSGHELKGDTATKNRYNSLFQQYIAEYLN